MTTIISRATKGLPLTHTEVDANFANLNSAKLEFGQVQSAGTANSIPYLNSSKVLTSGTALTFDGTNLGVGATINTGFGVSTGAVSLELGTLRTGDGTAFIDLHSTVGADYEFRVIRNAGVNGNASIINAGTGNFLLQQLGAGNLVFSTNALERMRLNSSGNLGLGVTPSAWSNFGPALQVQFGGLKASNFSTTNNQITLLNNAYEKQDTTYAYILGTNKASGYKQIEGAHQWLTAGTSTGAGDPITFTQAMTLDASGNLALGKTSATAFGSGYTTIDTEGASGSGIKFGTAAQESYIYSDASDMNIATAGAIPIRFATNGAERMRIDASGNLGIGTTSVAAYPNFKTFEVGSGGGTKGGLIQWTGASSTVVAQAYTDTTSSQFWTGTTTAHPYTFNTNGTEKMRLDASGNLVVGATGAGGRIQSSFPNTVYGFVASCTSATGTAFFHRFLYNSTEVGSITSTGTATTYATSSDYRLKNITGPITTSGAYIDSLKPVEGTWKADGSTFVGLIAHETQEASRTPVATGTKDGDEMQGMDYSSAEIIANLIAELQSLRARVAQLESK